MNLKFSLYNAHILWKHKDKMMLLKVKKLKIGQIIEKHSNIINSEVMIFRIISYLDMLNFSIDNESSEIQEKLLSLYKSYSCKYYDHMPCLIIRNNYIQVTSLLKML